MEEYEDAQTGDEDLGDLAAVQPLMHVGTVVGRHAGGDPGSSSEAS
jgi:hypothetical protein